MFSSFARLLVRRPRTGTTGLALALAMSLAVVLGTSVAQAATTLNNGPAPTVDGNRTEWGSADLLANLYEAGDPTKTMLGEVYGRYVCATGVLYLMVELENGSTDFAIVESDDDNFAKIDGDKKVDGDDAGTPGTQPDFSYSPDDKGWEASFSLAPGTYDLDVHALVAGTIDEEFEGDRTAAFDGRNLEITISCPSASPSPSPAASPSPSPSPSPAASPSPSPVATPDPSPSPSPVATPDPSPSPAASPSPSPVATPDPSPTAPDTASLPSTTSGGGGDGNMPLLIVGLALLAGAIVLLRPTTHRVLVAAAPQSPGTRGTGVTAGHPGAQGRRRHRT